MSRKMIIDTDTASDDAVALMMAFRHPDVEVVAVTIVAGNVPVHQGSINARYTAELCGAEVPVYEGAQGPLTRPYYDATWFHGNDGMGGMNYPAPKQPPAAAFGVDALIDHIRANEGIMVVTLGPLTNLALALAKAPDIVGKVSRCVVMGGAANVVGNVTPAAEYNIWCDPEAARKVFHSGLPVEMVGWELCRGEANLFEDEMRYYKQTLDTPLSHFVIDCNAHALKTNQQWLGDPGIGLPDPVAMAIALEPEICSRSSLHYVEVDCESPFTRGMTVVDQLSVVNAKDGSVSRTWEAHLGRPPHVRVCWEIDVPRWKALLERSVK
jgi:purine nucleosidase